MNELGMTDEALTPDFYSQVVARHKERIAQEQHEEESAQFMASFLIDELETVPVDIDMSANASFANLKTINPNMSHLRKASAQRSKTIKVMDKRENFVNDYKESIKSAMAALKAFMPDHDFTKTGYLKDNTTFCKNIAIQMEGLA